MGFTNTLSVADAARILPAVGFTNRLSVADAASILPAVAFFTNRLSAPDAASILPAVRFHKQVECGGHSQNPTCVERVRLETESYLHWVLKRG